MKGLYIFFLEVILITTGCGKNIVEQRQQVMTMREMSDLVTVEYVITKIIKANDNQTWYKPGDRKILMSCRASIKAGIDLMAIEPESIQINGKSINIQLPPTKIIALDMPPENIVVEYQDIDLFRSPFKAGERDALAAQAEAQIRSGAAATGILQSAEANAKQIITGFLTRLGYQTITFETNAPTLTPKKD